MKHPAGQSGTGVSLEQSLQQYAVRLSLRTHTALSVSVLGQLCREVSLTQATCSGAIAIRSSFPGAMKAHEVLSELENELLLVESFRASCLFVENVAVCNGSVY